MSASRAAPPSEGTVTLDVALLGRSYKVACKQEERAELEEAVTLLEGRLQEIRAGGKITGTERIAVMAALNLAHELMRERAAMHERAAPAPGATAPLADATSARASIDASTARRRIAAMQATIDRVLSASHSSA
jgi:cell division protein ZapA